MARKAAKGTGTIRKKEVTRNGKPYVYWEARITTGRDPGTGKQIQRSITGKTQKEVREKLQAVAVELNTGTYLEPSRMTVGEWLNTWIQEYNRDVKMHTQASYAGHVKNHLFPGLGAIRLQSLNATHVQAFYNSLQDKDPPLSSKTIKNIHGVLHKAMQQAVELGYIKFNPTDACKTPKVVKKELNPMEDQEITAFLKAIKGHRFERLFTVDIFTGMRQGELLGLKWEDIDFQKGTIHVRRQLVKDKKKGGAYYLASLKNDKTRKITPAPSVMAVLKAHKLAQTAQRLQAGPYWVDTGLVFTNETGDHMAHNTVYKSFKKVVRELGMSETRFHDLRHTYAVAALESGDDIKTLQENMGHHSAAFTLDQYGHVSERMKQESANRMERFIKGVEIG